MSNEDFRRELNNVFDDVSGSPPANLRDRVRTGVTQAPERRAPYWIAGVAACLIGAVIVGVLYVRGPLRPGTAGGPLPSPSPSAAATPSTQPTPSASPSASPFVCTSQNGTVTPSGSPAQSAFISALRPAAHGTYDRLVIDFANGVPAGVTVQVQSGTRFSPYSPPTTLIIWMSSRRHGSTAA